MAATMIISTFMHNPSGNARHFLPASGAPFGALVSRLLALPSFLLDQCGSANSGLGLWAGLGFGAGRLSLAVVRPTQWGMTVFDRRTGQQTAPIMAQGYGRSAPIARRC